MPTGYTAKLAEEEQSIADFINGCSRGMGYMVRMRDRPMDTPLPDNFTRGNYHKEELKRLHKREAELLAYSPEELLEAYIKYYDSELAYYNERLEKQTAQMSRYKNMLDAVKAWNPEHEYMVATKNFAIDQLKKSIDFDYYKIEKPESVSPKKWLEKELADIDWSINYHIDEDIKEEKRNKDLNTALKELKKELGKLQC